jgi:hypothetical protein
MVSFKKSVWIIYSKDVERAMEYKGFPAMSKTRDNANRLYEEVLAQYS